ncbi:MAG: hypothetical protein JO372_14475 [Solirubrobacterales bacterium]|nr:hypothetical protein [Solirubrobacterales bacterium]
MPISASATSAITTITATRAISSHDEPPPPRARFGSLRPLVVTVLLAVVDPERDAAAAPGACVNPVVPV